MVARPTAADLATFTGRASDDPSCAQALPVAAQLVERYYVCDPWTESHSYAQLLTAAYLLSARQAPSGLVGGDLGAVYLPTRLPVVDRLLRRRGDFA